MSDAQLPSAESPLFVVDGLTTSFKGLGGRVLATREVSFTVDREESLGIVGESGSGKSVSMTSALGLVPYVGGEVAAGSVHFDGEDLLAMSKREIRAVRGRRVGFIFQDPMTSLNPVFTIGRQVTSGMRRYLGLSKKEAETRAVELLDLMRIPDARSRLRSYPHQLSGGMRQRVMIAIALSCDPELLIADEPTTALDVTVQAQILELLDEIRTERRMAMIFITHDLAVVAGITDRIAVMYAGVVVEQGLTNEVLAQPKHPYTSALLRSMPTMSGPRQDRIPSIPGRAPALHGLPLTACQFAPRCPMATPECSDGQPELRALAMASGSTRLVACIHADSDVAVELTKSRVS